jgi:hypothetical protein
MAFDFPDLNAAQAHELRLVRDMPQLLPHGLNGLDDLFPGDGFFPGRHCSSPFRQRNGIKAANVARKLSENNLNRRTSVGDEITSSSV